MTPNLIFRFETISTNGLSLISTDWKRAKGENAFVGFPPKIPTSLGASYRTWTVVHNTNGQDRNNDAFAPHSAPSSLTAVGIDHDERQSSPLLGGVDSGL